MLFPAIADAQRETMLARRAADRVKMDEPGGARDANLSQDERDALPQLGASAATIKLMNLDAGSLSAEARAIGILCAADRMEIARGLPKHLKIVAVGGVYQSLFGVDPPALPADATKPLRGGAWLTYISKAASAAGHAVPARALSTLEFQELLAWGGTLEGFADQLRAQRARVSQKTELWPVIDGVVRKLDTEYRASEAAMLAATK